MGRSRFSLVVGAIVLVGLAGCGSTGSDAADTNPPAPSTTLTSVSTTPPSASVPGSSPTSATPASVPSALQPAVDEATADLATRLSIDPASIVVGSARTVTWPNGAIGCPKPGMSYIQTTVDGAEIILQVNGVGYRYTMGGSQGPTLCTQ